MDQLRESPYVLDVTQSIVHSAQFKALFYEGLQEGKAPAGIVMEHGIDPEILGVNRVSGLKKLCSLAGMSRCFAGMSRSGYYHYLSSEEDKQRRERQDREDFRRIVEAYQFRGYAKGAREIYMRLIHMEPPMAMNIKKIRRLMRKYGLKCPIRKANPTAVWRKPSRHPAWSPTC